MADSVFTIIGRAARNYTDTAIAAIDQSQFVRLDGANFTGEIVLRDGNPLGVLDNFYAGLLVSQIQVPIDTTEFDAVASEGSITIVGDTSPFSTTTISLSYSNPSEVTYTLSESSIDGVNTICDIKVDSCSKEAYENLANGGNITIGSSLVGFV